MSSPSRGEPTAAPTAPPIQMVPPPRSTGRQMISASFPALSSAISRAFPGTTAATATNSSPARAAMPSAPAKLETRLATSLITASAVSLPLSRSISSALSRSARRTKIPLPSSDRRPAFSENHAASPLAFASPVSASMRSAGISAAGSRLPVAGRDVTARLPDAAAMDLPKRPSRTAPSTAASIAGTMPAKAPAMPAAMPRIPPAAAMNIEKVLDPPCVSISSSIGKSGPTMNVVSMGSPLQVWHCKIPVDG